MPSLLLIVFVLQLAIHLINTVGAATLNDLLWTIYTKLPSSTSDNFVKVRKLRAELIRLKTELNSTSAQDEFAKWAKLQRQYDKVLAEHDKKAQDTQAFRASFDRIASGLRWTATNGLRFFLQFWFSKQPMFWLENGWVPYYIEWLLSFPRAPLGSISIQVWAGACAAVLSLFSAALVSIYGLLITTGAQEGEKKKVPVSASNAPSEKKEL